MSVEPKSIAMRVAAKAILATQLNVGKVKIVSIQSTEHYLGRVEIAFGGWTPTWTALGRRIVVYLATVPAGELLGESTEGDDIWRLVQEDVLKLASKRNPRWCMSDFFLPGRIVKKAMRKSRKLVQENETKIRALADALVSKGTIGGDELAALL